MMRKYKLLAFIAITSFSISCVSNQNKEKASESKDKDTATMSKTTSNDAKVDRVTVQLKATSDSKIKGTITFEEKNGEVKMHAMLSGLETGKHAIHLHKKADCSAKDGKSAGGHWNPTDEQHGKWGDKKGYHRGDIGNFDADLKGNANYKFSTKEWCIGCDDDQKDILGKAVIIHQGQDDFTSQPSGAAGKRIACGAIQK